MGLFARARDRRGTPADLLVVGLGNPGPDYAHSRHNAGVDTVALLAERHDGTLSSTKQHAMVAELRPGQKRLVVAYPLTFYNEAGRAVGALVKRHGIAGPGQVVVVHDEMDLRPARIKVKVGGGLAGNNGLKSVRAHLGSDAFVRVRIGIGKPPGSMKGRDYVLRRPGRGDRAELDIGIREAADAVETILEEGPEAAMARFNRRG